MADAVIFKIIRNEEWRALDKAGFYNGSAHDVADGFLHFSTASQVTETLRVHYAKESDGLIVAAVDALALGPALKYEHSASRNEDFPHLYGPLPMKAVLGTIFFHQQYIGERLQQWLDWAAAGGEGPTPFEKQ